MPVGEHWSLLKPLEQVSKGHILLIPNLHAADILELNDTEALAELGDVLNRTSKKLLSDFSATGINILNANRKSAQQSVFHLHFHIIPRYNDDNLDLWIREKL
jgi:histidine triad (HIT) family protein